MTPKRLEVRLRQNNPIERELIEALEAQNGIYGGKNELMRECLRRGYTTLTKKIESLPDTGDGLSTLDALAQLFVNGQYGYRVVETYLNVRNARKEIEQPARESENKTTPGTLDQPKVEGSPQTEYVGKIENQEQQKTEQKIDWSRLRGLAGCSESETDK